MIKNFEQIKQRTAKVVLAVLLLSSLQVAQNQNAFADVPETGLDRIVIADAAGTDFATLLEVDTTTALVASISYETNTVTIFPHFTSPTDSVTILSINFPSESITVNATGADSLTATLRVGSNTFTIKAFGISTEVTSSLTITRVQPDLRISFDPSGFLSSYDSVTARSGSGSGNSETFTVSSLTLLDTVTALSLSQVETITVGGSEFGSGNPWMIDELVIGEDNFFYVVTQAKVIGGESPIYETTTVTVRVPSLSNLTSTGTLSPSFNSFTKSYTVSVANTVSSITFTPTTGIGDFVDSITVAGESVTSTVASSPISLSVGANTVSIVVTATNDFHTTSYDTYTVTVTREAAAGGGGGGGGGSPAPTASGPVLKSQSAIKLNSSVTSIEFGGTFKISVSGGESSGSITYSASGDALCAIDSSGNVTALGKGTCTITATKAGDSAYASATSNSVTVTVTDITVPGVVAVGEVITPTLSISKPVAGTTTLRFKIDPIYSGDRVSVLLGTKKNGKTTYKTLGSASVSSSGAVTFKSKVKFNKGNLVRLKYGSTVIITKTI